MILFVLLIAIALQQAKNAIKQDGKFLTDMVFTSLYSLMKEGWHEDDINKKMELINQAYPHGSFHLHRSNLVKELFGDREKKVLSQLQRSLLSNEELSSVSEIDSNGMMSYSSIILFEQDCLSCHTNALAGQKAGLLMVSYPLSSVNVSVLHFVLSNVFIFIVVIVICQFIYRKVVFKEILSPLAKLSTKISHQTQSKEVMTEFVSDSKAIEISEIEHHLHQEHQKLILAHEKIKQISMTDSLTQLKNRNVLVDTFATEVSLHSRHGIAFSLISIDLNDFKPINDTYGHDVGDAALIHFSTLLINKCRSSDTVIRIGGDEFLVFLTGTEETKVEAFINGFKVELKNKPLMLSTTQLTLQASFGFEVYREGMSIDEMLKIADTNMYKDKQMQKNSKF